MLWLNRILFFLKSQKDKCVNGYNNHLWNGVTCLQLSKIIGQIIAERTYWQGTRHIFSPTHVSKYELVEMISDIYNLNITVNKYDTDEPIDKTLDTTYNTCKLLNIPELHSQLIDLQQYRD